MSDGYNIKIETSAQLTEIQKLLSELREINAEISKINGQTFSAASVSASELSSISKNLITATKSQTVAIRNLNESTKQTSNTFGDIKNKSEVLKDKFNASTAAMQGFHMELGNFVAKRFFFFC